MGIQRWLVVCVIGCLGCFVGCEGQLRIVDKSEGPGDGSTPVGTTGGTLPGAQCVGNDIARPVLRRLTPLHYRNTVRDLFGLDDLDPPPLDDNESETVSLLAAEKFGAAAEVLANAVLDSNRSPVTRCADDESCLKNWVTELAARAFRRPLTNEEQSWLDGIYASGAAESAEEAARRSIEVILQVPQFIYRVEIGEGAPGLAPGVRRLTGHELATRLSYFLWNTMPDEELFRAAASGELTTEGGLSTQVERMLDSDRAREMVRTFFSTWLGLDELEFVNKNPDAFPELDSELRAAMREETLAFVERVVFDDDATIRTLLTARYAYVNEELAALYGVSGGPTGAEWAWVDLPAEERSGLLSRLGFLTLRAGAILKSPILRGVFIRRHLLCDPIGMPPPDVADLPIVPAEIDPNARLTLRQATERRTEPSFCSTCHGRINPVGFALENFDAIGRWHASETGVDPDGTEWSLPIDASGDVLESDVEGPLYGTVELSERLAGSGQVVECLARKWMSFALGNDPSECGVGGAASNGNLRDLIVSIAQSEAFQTIEEE